MTRAEKLQMIAENEQKVFEAGKKSEQEDFWDVFQNKGTAANYRYAFCYSRFDDSTFNPKYDINCTDVESSAQYMFYQSAVTDTKVGIYAPSTNAVYCFRDSALETIRLFSVHASTIFTNTFTGCSKLRNITMGGTIGQDISFSASSLLSADSIQSIIDALGTVTSTKTITFHTSVVAKLTDEQVNQIVSKGWEIG